MVNGDLNKTVREMCSDVMECGYKKNTICSVTIGGSYSAQFNKFIDGTDFGINPMTRLVEGCSDEYELHVVPVKKTDKDSVKIVDDLVDDFIVECKETIIDKLESRTIQSKRSKNPETEKALMDTVYSILDGIE